MKYLDYIGDLYYRPHHDFNGNIHFLKKTALAAFLFGTVPASELKARKIALLGTGADSLFCTDLLARRGIEVAAYCDNDLSLVGKVFHGKMIHSPFSIYQSGQYHIIACPDSEQFEAVVDQFSHCGVTDYSLFFQVDTVVDYKQENMRELLLNALNCLINVHDDPQTHHNAPLGITMRLLPSIEWWSQELFWLYDDMQVAQNAPRILDIGPGFGLVSVILKLLRPDSELHWLNLEIKDYEDTSYIDPETKKYPIVRHFGVVEDPAYQLSEKFDVIIMTELFEHFASAPVPTMRKIAGMLSDHGRIYLSTPNWERANFYASWRDIPPFPGDRQEYCTRNKSRIEWKDLNLIHTYIYRESELRDIFAESGLAVERFVLNECNNFNFVLTKQI